MPPAEKSPIKPFPRGGVPDWATIVLAFLVVLASFLGGATQRWSQAIVIGGFALLLLAYPPRASLGPALNTLALLFLALAAVAFLPARWFVLPDWRVALTKDFNLQLGPTLSPQPWLTLDSLFTVVAGLAWLYYVAALNADLRDVRRTARTFAGGIIALALISIYLNLKHSTLPF